METLQKNDVQSLKQIALKCAHTLDEKKAEDIVLLNISEKTPMADYFLVAGAESFLQLKVLSKEIDRVMHEYGINRINPKNPFSEASWLLNDYGFIVVHLFLNEAREYYNIEKFWHDANVEFKNE